MPTARIAVTAVSDEGNSVIVWGRFDDAPSESKPIGFVFRTGSEQSDVALAERASQLARGTVVVIDYTAVADDWNLARSLAAAQ